MSSLVNLELLKVFDNIDDAYELEHTLVNKEFVKRKDTYNIALGGNKGNYYYPINQFDKVMPDYDEARRYCDDNGIKIYNATRGGKLESFVRVDVDKLLK